MYYNETGKYFATSPPDLYTASQKYVFDVLDHVTDFLTVFSWLPISFALRVTLLSN